MCVTTTGAKPRGHWCESKNRRMLLKGRQMNVTEAMTELKDMTANELRQRYAELFGEKTASRHKDFLRRRIIWRMQMQAEGGLSERARARAEELADEADLRMYPPKRMRKFTKEPVRCLDSRLPMHGAILVRKYKGREIRVTVLKNGFEYDGKVYRTLSAVAQAVTGTHWNGYHFFNLAKKGKDSEKRRK
jgi:hypothetical protein